MYSSDDHVMMERYDHVTMGRYDFDDGALRSYDRIMTGRYYCVTNLTPLPQMPS